MFYKGEENSFLCALKQLAFPVERYTVWTFFDIKALLRVQQNSSLYLLHRNFIATDNCSVGCKMHKCSLCHVLHIEILCSNISFCLNFNVASGYAFCPKYHKLLWCSTCLSLNNKSNTIDNIKQYHLVFLKIDLEKALSCY